MLLNQNHEEVTFGIVYFCLSAPQLPLFFLVILAVHRKNAQKPNLTLKIVNFINSLQFVQSVGHFITSPILMFPELQSDYGNAITAIGCLMSTVFIAELPTVAILAVCRILIFCRRIRPDRVPMFLKILLFLGVIGEVGMFIFNFTFTMHIFKSPSWTMNFKDPVTSSVANVELAMFEACLLIAYVSYVIIVLMIFVKTRGSTISPSSRKSRRRELSILVQYSVFTVYTTFSIIFWNKAGLFLDAENAGTQAAVNISWIAGIYLNPVMLLIINSQIRRECARIIGVETDRRDGTQMVFSVASSVGAK